jgi:signal transduction histidine kinase
MLFPSRLHATVTAGIVLPLLVLMLAFTYLGYRRQNEATLAELSKMAAYTGRVVESDLRHQMLESDFEGLQGLLDTIAAEEEIERLYLLDTSGEVIFAPHDNGVGLRLDNRQPECQPCHSLAVAERPDSIVVTTAAGERIFRSMAPIENSPECAKCHEEAGPLIGMLLIDISVAPFAERLTAYLQQNLLLWIAIITIITLVVYVVVERLVLHRLDHLIAAIGGLGRGVEPPPVPEGPGDEIGQLVRAFNRMSGQIRRRDRQNEALSEKLQEESAQRGQLLRHLIHAQEDERLRVARDLHDQLGQSLTGLALRAQAMERHVLPDDSRGQGILQQTRALIAATTEQMYDIIMALRPSVLDDLGLVSALHAYAGRVLEDSDLVFQVDAGDCEFRLPAELETAVFRIFQEGITNALRHAEATQIRVTLRCGDGKFEGVLADDGRGFEPGALQRNGHNGRGWGLLGMQERVIQCGGQIGIDSVPEQGTRIRIILPLPEGAFAGED